MTVGDAVRRLRDRLREAGIPSPDVDAALLASHALGWPTARVRREPAAAWPPDAAARLEALARRRVAREPLQLLVGTVGFRYLELEVRPGVFIPRPETEVVAGEAVAATPPGGVVVEPCTGTGAIACAVADEVTRRDGAAPTVIATDIDAAAVDLARANAARCGAVVEVHRGDLLDPVPSSWRNRVDVVVANPPYVAAREVAGLEPEVTDWDPAVALVAGETGHEVTDRIIVEAPDWLRPGGCLVLEVADTRAAETARRCATAGYVGVRVATDLTGRDRIVAARTPSD